MSEYMTGEVAANTVTRYGKIDAPSLRVSMGSTVGELMPVRDEDGARHWGVWGGGAASYTGVMRWCRKHGYDLLTVREDALR